MGRCEQRWILGHSHHLRQGLSVPICPSGFTPSMQPMCYRSFWFVPWSQLTFLLVPDHFESGTCTEPLALDFKTSVSAVIAKADLLHVGQIDTQAEQHLWGGSSSDGASSLPTGPRPGGAAASGSTSQQ